MTKIVVLAKAPIAGRVKTRLCPPLTPDQAASVAEAALLDTLAAANFVRDAKIVLALDGPGGRWLPSEVSVIAQRGDRLDERIAAAFEDAGGPALLIGMDTPQVTPRMLAVAVQTLARPGIDAVLGRAEDGGWWAAGMRRPDPKAFIGVPMSTTGTGSAQRRRFRELGLEVAELGRLRDFDTFADAVAVADEGPHTRFARVVEELIMGRHTTAVGGRA